MPTERQISVDDKPAAKPARQRLLLKVLKSLGWKKILATQSANGHFSKDASRVNLGTGG
jgi:hypothetical protein